MLRTPCGVGLVAVLLWSSSAHAQYGATNGEWRTYGGDLGGTKYSPLDQIDASNFSDIEVAWRWQSADGGLDLDALREIHPEIGIRNFKTTPLMVGGVVYVSTPLVQSVALDAGTGEVLWVYDPQTYLSDPSPHARFLSFNSRGLAYWTDGQEERLLYGTNDGYLLAVNAKTGQPVRSFGDNGRVDLMEGIPRAVRGTTDSEGFAWLGVASPPIVAHDVVVTPTVISDIPDNMEAPPGWVKGIDVRTGDTKWTFHTVPQADDFGTDSWLNESWRYSGNNNVWAMMSVDDELGYIYLPTGTPTSDYYGGHRLGDNLFAESLVALDIETGRRIWHFQAVHHGLWDYDFPTHPNLIDITVPGRDGTIRAIAQVSKQGFTYVFDRETGEPVWPIEERAVATDTNLAGDVLAPTQPFPTKPPPFEYQGSTIDDLVDFTPRDPRHGGRGGDEPPARTALHAADDIRAGRPPRDDPATRGHRRCELGGLRGRSRDRSPLCALGERLFGDEVRKADPAAGSNLRYITSLHSQFPTRTGGGGSPLMPQGLPLFKPPYSPITAIDLNTGDHAWMQPNGDGDRYRNHPMLRDLDLPPLGGEGRGGPVLTRTLLISALTAGGADGGPRLVARDKATGVIVGSVDLPGGAIGTPMTYLHEGRQYIALTVGGDIPELIALALPR